MSDVKSDMAFNAEAARAGMFAAALDMIDTMREAGVEQAEAAVLTGAIEMATQLWTKVMLEVGHPPQMVRVSLEKQIRVFFRKHSQLAKVEAE